MLVGLDWAEPMMHLNLHVHAFLCIHTFLFLSFDIKTAWYFSDCLSLSLSLVSICLCLSLYVFLTLVASWHLNVSLLHPGTLFIPEHPLLLTLLPHMFGSVMIKPDRTFRRTFLDKAFIQNAKSFCWTSPTLTNPLSFTVRVGSHYVMS